jgi:hypothetical protein
MLVIGAAVLFIVGGLTSYRDSGWSITSIGFAAMAVLACGGVLELATSRIALLGDVLESGSAWSRQRYAAADIASVTWESGCGVSIKLLNGGWAKLPELGYNSQGLANSLRAWLKRSRQTGSRGGAAEQGDEADEA